MARTETPRRQKTGLPVVLFLTTDRKRFGNRSKSHGIREDEDSVTTSSCSTSQNPVYIKHFKKLTLSKAHGRRHIPPSPSPADLHQSTNSQNCPQHTHPLLSPFPATSRTKQGRGYNFPYYSAHFRRLLIFRKKYTPEI